MVTLTLSPEEYEALVKERDEYKKAYENGVTSALNRSVYYEGLRKQQAKELADLKDALKIEIEKLDKLIKRWEVRSLSL